MQWRPVITPGWAPVAMYDVATATSKGDSVTAWIRFVDMPAHSPAEINRPQRLCQKGAQIESYMTLDCVKPGFGVVRTCITDNSDKILGEADLTRTTQPWRRWTVEQKVVILRDAFGPEGLVRASVVPAVR